MKLRVRFLVFGLLAASAVSSLGLSSCSTVRSMGSPSRDYRAFLESNVQEKRIFDRGREMLAVKILPVTPEWRAEQAKLTPVPSVPLKDDVRQVILAVNVIGREPAYLLNWKISLGGRPFLTFSEILDNDVIENEYPFAYPFDRVYALDFPKPDASVATSNGKQTEKLEVLSPYGRIAIDCEFPGGERNELREQQD